MCSFVQLSNGSLHWINTNGSNHNGINVDHTTGSETGHYITLTNSSSTNNSATMVSPMYAPSSGECLQFYYHIHGNNGGSLKVQLHLKTSESIIWQMQGEQGDDWKIAQVTIKTLTKYQLSFSGWMLPGSGDVSLDDISILPFPCAEPGSCDFETDFCTFTNSKTDQFDWILGFGDTKSLYSGPSTDHTTGTVEGHYIFIDSTTSLPGDKAQLVSETLHPTPGSCLVFYYNMNGAGMGSLNVYKSTQLSQKLIFNQTGHHANAWLQSSVNLTSVTPYTIIFEGVKGANNTSDIALDDISVSQGACGQQNGTGTPGITTTPLSIPNLGCDFENGICQWTQDTSNQFNWTWQQGSTATADSGPRFDHTQGNIRGHYVDVDASHAANATARLRSPQFSNTGSTCATFWYHMYGADVNKLNLYLASPGKPGSQVWTKSGNQGFMWQYAEVEVGAVSSAQLIFEAVCGTAYMGDIALDDISIISGPCPAPGKDLSFCDFEDTHMCGFVQSISDQFDWVLETGATTPDLGPKVDHTYGSIEGHFIYLKPVNFGGEALLLSKPYNPTFGSCLTFWYYQRGGDVGTIFVSIVPVGEEITPSSIWRMDDDQGTQWHLAAINIENAEQFQVVFKGSLSGYGGGIALDDIRMSPISCQVLADCDFEQGGICTWTQSQNDDFDWLVNSGETASLDTGPPSDHTTGTESGEYIYLPSMAPLHPGYKAILISQIIPLYDLPDLCFTFWYYMWGSRAGTLNISYHIQGAFSDEPVITFTRTGNQGNNWIQGFMDIPQPWNAITIFIMGSIGNGDKGDIALDDFKLYSISCDQVKGTTSTAVLFKCNDAANTTVTQDKVCNFIRDCPPPYLDEANCGDCDFNDDNCQWTEASNSIWQWSLGNGQSNASRAVPKYDHSGSTTDSFLYLDKGTGTQADFSDIYSIQFGPCSSTCQMQLFYYISGQASQVRVLLEQAEEKTVLWATQGRDTDKWVKATVDILRVATPFRIHIQGYTALTTSFQGIVAVDDVQFENCNFPVPGNCDSSQTQFHCNSSACIPMAAVCDFTDDCGDGSDEASCGTYPSRTDFEQSLGAWYNDQSGSDNFDWIRMHGSTSTSGTGPSRDHSRGTSSGYYMYIDSSPPSKPGDKAWLLSIDAFNPTLGSTCALRFYYHMYGAAIGNLNIYTRISLHGNLKQILSLSGNYGDAWMRKDIILQEKELFQIVIEGVVGNGYLGDIGIDDISMTSDCQVSKVSLPSGSTPLPTQPAPCSANQFACDGYRCIPRSQVCDFHKQCSDGSDELMCGDCTFEAGLCGWRDHSTGQFAWVRKSLNESASTGGPSSDADGGAQYIIVQPTMGVTQDPARLMSPVLNASAAMCCMNFSYHMFGSSAGNLRILLQQTIDIGTDNGIDLWHYSGTAGNAWQQYSVRIGQIDYPFVITFSSLPTPGFGRYDVAIDNIAFSDCQNEKIFNHTEVSMDCSFDLGLCGYSQVQTDNFDWSLTDISTPTEGTGPDRDHTSGTGCYIYIETSTPQKPGDVADLTSPLQAPTSPEGKCLKFWYHMFGAHVETLNVFIQQDSNRTLIWTRSNTQGNIWRQALRTIVSYQSYKVIFEGVVGVSFLGDIAIDDVSLVDEPCPPSLECDFEADFCDYTQSTDDQFDWIRHANNLSQVNTGPSWDHTALNREGYYAYLTTGPPHKAGDRAVIVSPVQQRSLISQCLTFWYQMYGFPSVGQLNLYIISNGTRSTSPVFSVAGDHGSIWIQAAYTLPPPKASWQIMIEAVVGQSDAGDIAIDDIKIQEGDCPPPGSCNFEVDTCSYYNIEGYGMDDFDWLRSAGGTVVAGTGPAVDHTSDSDAGFYMYMQADTHSMGQRASFSSSPIPCSPQMCISFWYHMYGQDEGTLVVYQSGEQLVTLMTMTGDQGDFWHYWENTTSCDSSFELIFDGTVGNGSRGDIAIDDVSVKPGNCTGPPATDNPGISQVTYAPTKYDCNFDQASICNWIQDITDNFNWTLHHGATASLQTGPSYDHTQQNINGYYIYTEASHQPANATARIMSQTVTINNTGLCVHFWFHMYGSSIGLLNVYAQQGKNLGNPLWTRSGEQGDKWISATLFLTPQGLSPLQNQTTIVQIVFEGVLTRGYQSDIALDDISFNNGNCPTSVSCSFDSDDICGYLQETIANYSWTRQRGHTPSSGTGPAADHTYGTMSGYYMYAEASKGNPGENANLLSPVQPATTGKCLHFYYHMSGTGMGTLMVSIRARAVSTVIWRRFSDQGDDWHTAQVSINSNFQYQVEFQAVRGSTYQSDIAIDDVELQDGLCSLPASCDFEQGQCAWSNDDADDDFDWIRSQGSTITANTGPTSDHTLQNIKGHYMYIEASQPRKPGDKARLHSEILNNSSHPQCLTFWYNMHGAGMGTLSVYKNLVSRTSGLIQLWTLSGDQGAQWQKASVPVHDNKKEFMLVFEGVVGSSYLSDMAIDDVSLTDGDCSSSSQPSKFTCRNQQTVTSDKVCNFVKDCSDGSDEVQCGNCTFEVDLCGYNDISKGSFRYLRTSNSTSTKSLPIPFDHSYNKNSGYLLYVDTSRGTFNSLATLASPVLHQSSPACQLYFYYFIIGSAGAGQLQVSVMTGDTKTIVWQLRTSSVTNQWLLAVADIGALMETSRFT
ncbi:MAM and LDL-receptor class A domain-containing protein 1-like [Pomacea canaliculata]|uniref:MAM and LDL-receptor class A domain-containing protein 1-like n=1 Tax=Pomacea canaliculata TaxID=400727 RepID=UPI000D7274F7|nr:MAM and LDL-receptor class A domain-containing protein 1-like [Pomacea canaliculata]